MSHSPVEFDPVTSLLLLLGAAVLLAVVGGGLYALGAWWIA